MILFKQGYVQDGLISGTVLLDGEPIGEFRVTVPQWDELRAHEDDNGLLMVWNEDQARRFTEAET